MLLRGYFGVQFVSFIPSLNRLKYHLHSGVTLLKIVSSIVSQAGAKFVRSFVILVKKNYRSFFQINTPDKIRLRHIKILIYDCSDCKENVTVFRLYANKNVIFAHRSTHCNTSLSWNRQSFSRFKLSIAKSMHAGTTQNYIRLWVLRAWNFELFNELGNDAE